MITRRAFVSAGCIGIANKAFAQSLEMHIQHLNPSSCGVKFNPTPNIPDPLHFREGSPNKASFVDDAVEGERFLFSGRVLSIDCTPLSGVLIDFWHADQDGNYDSTGYRFRGWQVADSSGRFSLQTIMPSGYGGAAPHVHVHIHGTQGIILQSAAFFPSSSDFNRAPPFIDYAMEGRLKRDNGGMLCGEYNFIVDSSKAP